MRFLNVFTKQQFNNGQELVTLWHKIGVIKQTKNGGTFLQLFHQPNTDFYVFEEKEKEDLPEIQVEE
ncbi:MAG: hypothetical protein K1X55_10265 [Chitinophagales bacterium]|nr:hypothetical protein [Chitinophagales bacterium]